MTIFLDIHQKPIELPANEKVHWRVAAYPLVRSSDDKILLVTIQENSKFYILPGGEVELQESLIEGLQRECYEETGYKVTVNSPVPLFVGETHFYHNGFFHCINLVFSSSITDLKQDMEVINSVEANEIASVDWIELSKISEKNCHPMFYPATKAIQ